jgi:predicted Zn-dependent protease with MMP-like domain
VLLLDILSHRTSVIGMKREDFVKVAEDPLDSLLEEFRSRTHNVAILVEDFPPNQSPLRPDTKCDCF